MKKLILFLIAFFITSGFTHAQHIVFQSDFENLTLHLPDSLPNGWAKIDVDGNNPSIGWAVRDTSVHFGSGNTRPKAHNSAKSLEIPWYAGSGGNNINDDWVFTDTFTCKTGDSLIFWLLIGSDSTFSAYLDSMQVYVASDQDPSVVIQKLATIRSNDSAGVPLNNNVWTRHSFVLSAFNNQRITIAFRYNMNISVDGLWCNIDDIFIGNRAPIGIQPISTNIPKYFDISQNYPNPFNPITNINFALPKAEFVNIAVYDILGKEVRKLANEYLQPGTYKVDFDASNLPSGVYFYRIIAGDAFTKTKKMILAK